MTSMQPLSEHFATLQEFLNTAATELFEAFGVPLQLSDEEADTQNKTSESVVAVIGYGSDKLRGAVIMLAEKSVAEAFQPADLCGEGVDPTDAIRDVIGELSNQLLGRLKNMLVVRGVNMVMATPTTAIGQNLRVFLPSSGASSWRLFRDETRKVFIRFDAVIEPGFELAEPTPQAESSVLDEGDMMLF